MKVRVKSEYKLYRDRTYVSALLKSEGQTCKDAILDIFVGFKFLFVVAHILNKKNIDHASRYHDNI